MKKKILSLAAAALIFMLPACHKADAGGDTNTDPATVKTDVIKDFTNIVALPTYKDLDNAALRLYTDLQQLNANGTETNLQTAKNSWKGMRTTWEQAEGFLFGPVEDNDYDPNMDTWPTDFKQMDSLLASSHKLSAADVQGLTLSLRGYHPIEYILFGNHGDRKAAQITARQKEYMMGLGEDLKNTCHLLYASWAEKPVYFANQVLTAGQGSLTFPKKQQLYIALVNGMMDICEEVGSGKMKEPYDAQNPDIVESPYSGNSIADFKNNIIGLQNVYLGDYAGYNGKGLTDFVSLTNKALDNKIKTAITTAINSFDNITLPYEQAIITQRVQSKATMDALGDLKTILEKELVPFITKNITD